METFIAMANWRAVVARLTMSMRMRMDRCQVVGLMTEHMVKLVAALIAIILELWMMLWTMPLIGGGKDK